jgi:transposase InsO family protein
MRDEAMNGLVRGRHIRTTIPAKTGGTRAADLLNRCFNSPGPNHGWVTDFTYVPTCSGFVYVAFAIDLYSRAIVGWSASTCKDVSFVEQALFMALWRRDDTDRPVLAGMIHHWAQAASTPRSGSPKPLPCMDFRLRSGRSVTLTTMPARSRRSGSTRTRLSRRGRRCGPARSAPSATSRPSR